MSLIIDTRQRKVYEQAHQKGALHLAVDDNVIQSIRSRSYNCLPLLARRKLRQAIENNHITYIQGPHFATLAAILPNAHPWWPRPDQLDLTPAQSHLPQAPPSEPFCGPYHVYQNLYVGDFNTVCDIKKLQELNITRLINCTTQYNLPCDLPYLSVPFDIQTSKAELDDIVGSVCNFVQKHTHENIIFFSDSGRGRAPFLAGCVVQRATNWTYDTLTEFLLRQVPELSMNISLEVYLLNLCGGFMLED